MISFICGTVVESNELSLVVECSGMGYEVFASSKTLEKLGNIGQKITIFTHLSVREDGLALFGFYSNEEKSMFLKLISVSGIGPKVALAILSGISLKDLFSCIAVSDFERLSQIKGIGKKTAERIVLELKDKISADFTIAQTAPLSLNQDAVLALVAMGFSKQEAQSKVAKVFKDGMSTEQIILSALK